MTGRPATASLRFRDAARSWWRTRRSGWALSMAHAGQRRRGDGRRQRGGEDEARAAGAHEVDDDGGRGDVAADHAERLGERALARCRPCRARRRARPRRRRARRTCRPRGPRRDRSARRSDGPRRRSRRSARCRRPSNRPIRRRRSWASTDRRRPAVPRDGPRRCGGRSCARAPQWRMPAIIEAWFSASEIEIAARQHGAQRLQRGLVGDIARGEDERGFLAVQRGQLALERDVQRVGAGDVARAAGARALRVDRLAASRRATDRVLAHGRGSRCCTRR